MRFLEKIGLILLIASLTASCSESEFAGESDQAVRPTKKPSKVPSPSTNLEKPTTDTPKNDQLIIDDGGQTKLPGTPVERVGVGFEDGVDADYNDL